jgi:hypothetical protein
MVMSHQLGVRPQLGDSETEWCFPATIQQTKVQIEQIHVWRKAGSEQAYREFSIERSAKAFIDAIKSVLDEQA